MPHQPLIIGHRGASALAPENTMAAFRKAIDAGADGIEFDVRLSQDRIPVVIHDETLERTGLCSDAVGSLTAAELQQMNVGRWFGVEQFSNETLPTLTNLLDTFSSGDAMLYLEMKCQPEETGELVSITCNTLEAYSLTDRVVVECFDLEAIHQVKQIKSKLQTAALFQPRISRPHSWTGSNRLIEEALAAGADEIALHYKLANDRMIERANEAGLRVVVWTVDDPAWVVRAQNSGIHALITNDPAAMIARDTF